MWDCLGLCEYATALVIAFMLEWWGEWKVPKQWDLNLSKIQPDL
jgi:hypothetical protein